MRRPSLRTSILVIALVVGLSACGEPDVTRDDLVSMLTERGGAQPGDITDAEANCIADAVFADGAFTQSELNKAALKPDEVPGFQDAIDAAIPRCLNAG
jgi:hypothetical protein